MRIRSIGPLMALLALALMPASASAAIHVVAPGETLTSVAATDGLSVSALAAANGLSPTAELVAGSLLQIPPQSSATAAPVTSIAAGSGVTDSDGDNDGDVASGSTATPSTAPVTSAGPSGYIVQPGDTLSALAARAGTTVAQLAAMNGLDPNGVLLAGQAIQLPGAGGPMFVSTSSSSPGTVAESQPVGTAALTGSGNGPYPTPERVSGSEIAGIASATGVPSSFAQAIGWQESGWNNDLVSATGAVGVMQIEPGTWDWIQRTLTAGTPLSPASAADNVRGGALLLHSLLAATGSESMAAAAYYQGLSSVQQNGLFPDTQQYVNDVMSLASQFGGG